MPTNVTTDTSIDIGSSGNAATREMGGRTTLDLAIRGDGAASYTVDISADGSNWYKGVGPSYSGSADYSDTIQTGAAYVRLRCTSGTTTSGDQANILLSAGGD